MSILITDPPQDALASTNSALDYCDAPTHDEAIRQIDEWARRHGFARVGERWLAVVSREDIGTCFKGVCYRLSEEDRAGAEERLGAFRSRRLAMRESPDSAVLQQD
ncbi:MAG: hypothetical protein BWZ08_00925 [candidate division BRC1 bacterium ADurb.BinA292]|nr:MAG: hypothetical protein BWZ08_00925 [candidate division BRC1 bacterium ADurb.BinA292]